MAQFIFRRGKQFRDRIRAYQIWIDGAEAGRLKHDSEVRIEVSPGEHEVQLRIDWCSSQKVFVLADRDKIFDCCNKAFPLLVLIYITLLYNHYLGMDYRDA